jgi:hypothetical protein
MKHVSMDMLYSPIVLCMLKRLLLRGNKKWTGDAFSWASQVSYSEDMTQRQSVPVESDQIRSVRRQVNIHITRTIIMLKS